jgi:hypothetical protein
MSKDKIIIVKNKNDIINKSKKDVIIYENKDFPILSKRLKEHPNKIIKNDNNDNNDNNENNNNNENLEDELLNSYLEEIYNLSNNIKKKIKIKHKI